MARLLSGLTLGSSVAEQDNLLQQARVDTSAFSDLLADKIDLIPGTKGSGKTALYRIFVDFLPDVLLQNRKVVIAHGVRHHGDSVFQAFKDSFESLDEDDFVSFWCIYFISLANRQFVLEPRYAEHLSACHSEIREFRKACIKAKVPEILPNQPLRSVLGWILSVLKAWKPKLKYTPPQELGELQLDLFGDSSPTDSNYSSNDSIPHYLLEVADELETILKKAHLHLWLMIDRLDELFPRRSSLETRALRGLLRTLRIFESPSIRVKVFLRDDILDQIVSSGEGFTALTHVTARQADTLRWSEPQILTMIVKRLFAHQPIATYYSIDTDKLNSNTEYQEKAFYRIFPATIHSGKNQSKTLRWILKHASDAHGVVTPRDIIDLLTRAIQKQQDEFRTNPIGLSDTLIGSSALRYGISELSKRKRTTILEAEFSHLWPHIKKFVGRKAEYTEKAIRDTLGSNWADIMEDLIAIGLFAKTGRSGHTTYKMPYVYRHGLEVTRGKI